MIAVIVVWSRFLSGVAFSPFKLTGLLRIDDATEPFDFGPYDAFGLPSDELIDILPRAVRFLAVRRLRPVP